MLHEVPGTQDLMTPTKAASYGNPTDHPSGAVSVDLPRHFPVPESGYQHNSVSTDRLGCRTAMYVVSGAEVMVMMPLFRLLQYRRFVFLGYFRVQCFEQKVVVGHLPLGVELRIPNGAHWQPDIVANSDEFQRSQCLV